MCELRGTAGLLAVLLIAGLPSAAQEPAPASRPAPPAEYKIVFWFVKRDPIDTFRHRVYDVRKGEYTPAVDQWLAMMAKQYPAYEAYVRDLHLVPGQPEKAQVSQAITRELYVTAAYYGGVPAEVLMSPAGRGRAYPGPDLTIGSGSPVGGSGFRMSLKPVPRVDGSPGSGAGVPLAPAGYPFPVPYPYPRPHP